MTPNIDDINACHWHLPGLWWYHLCPKASPHTPMPTPNHPPGEPGSDWRAPACLPRTRPTGSSQYHQAIQVRIFLVKLTFFLKKHFFFICIFFCIIKCQNQGGKVFNLIQFPVLLYLRLISKIRHILFLEGVFFVKTLPLKPIITNERSKPIYTLILAHVNIAITFLWF